jgi:hypothetical protein
VLLKALNIAFVVEAIVFVDPYDLVQASFNPANFNRVFIFSPATKPNPLGPGSISIVTLPPLPDTWKGIECN